MLIDTARTAGTRHSVPFDIDADYRRYVDGKPRYDGVAAFLESRGIELPQDIERLDMRIRYHGHSLDLRLTRDSLTVRGRDGAAAPISLCVDDKVCEFVNSTTRVFRLYDEATDGVIVEKDPTD